MLFVLASCHSHEASMNYGPTQQKEASSPKTSSSGKKSFTAAQRKSKIIRTAVLSGQVDDLQLARQLLHNKMSNYEAFIAHENEQQTEVYKNSLLTIKVTNSSFENLLSDLQSILSETTSKQIKSQDVSEEHIDVTTRLQTKRKVMQRYQDFLKMAVNIEEILEVEEKVRVIQEEIESAEARLRYMDKQVQLSTISLTMRQKEEVKVIEAGIGWIQDFKDAFLGGWNGVLLFLITITYLWPFLFILILFYFIGKRKNWFRTKTALVG